MLTGTTKLGYLFFKISIIKERSIRDQLYILKQLGFNKLIDVIQTENDN